MLIDLFRRQQTHFLLWRPAGDTPPALILRSSDRDCREIPLTRSSFPDLWELAAADAGLTDGQVYWYWFKVQNTSVYSRDPQIVYCTDPMATTIDRRFPAPDGSGNPASVVLYKNAQLLPCDPDGNQPDWQNDPPLSDLPPNHRLVIYELPTRWTRSGAGVGTGTFRDVVALVQPEAEAPDFQETDALRSGKAHLLELGVNAIELLPPADSVDKYNDDQYKWGYGTANYFAADYDLGRPEGQDAPSASVDLVNLIKVCHQYGIRFFLDAVMAFSRGNPYHNVNFLDFYIHWKPIGAPDRDPEQHDRDGFGGDLFKYNYWVDGYHPLTGQHDRYVPAREYLKAHMAHWMLYYRIDGLRLDSVNNVGNYDFLQEFKDLARKIWRDRNGSDDRFLVVGEELSVPLALVHQNRLDSLWNERFKQILRQVILGRSSSGDSFEWSVRKLIDCRLLGFRDCTQAVNYLTSHDVGGHSNERIYNYLVNNGVADCEERIKLAFVCLLTAVGIPMILAGDEFADQHDLPIDQEHGNNKQVDPVNYSRMNEDWRRRIFDCVSRLVRFRTASDALATNDTVFLHVDFEEGKRVLVWQRGYGENLVVVVANFSDYGTPNVESGKAEYVISNWPSLPDRKHWKEITQDRTVDRSWQGREPIFPWEAKVYASVEGAPI